MLNQPRRKLRLDFRPGTLGCTLATAALAAVISAAIAAPVAADSEPADGADRYVMLLPDFRNDVVHKIALDGTYEGDFLDAERIDGGKRAVERIAWGGPRGLVFAEDGDDSKVWLLAERSLSEWRPDGTFVKLLYSDAEQLADPTGIARIGDEVWVLSEDKKQLLVFGSDGKLARRGGYPQFDRARDLISGPDGRAYVGSGLHSRELRGLVSVWLAGTEKVPAGAAAYKIAPEPGKRGTISVHSLVFDAEGDLVITDFARGRVERWDLDENKKLEVLLSSRHWGTYRELARGPDGKIYLSGAAGIYRFDSRAKASELTELAPFFDAGTIAERYPKGFAPSQIVFVKRSSLPSSTAEQAPPVDATGADE